MANQGTTLTQSGQQVQALLNKIDNLGPATQEQAGTLSAEDKAKLDGIETGADVSVNPDWNASSGKAQILNKPTIPTRLAQMDDDGMHRTVTDADKTNWNSKTSFSGNYNDLTNKPDLSQFITKSVDDLLYYYTKSESYTKTQIDNLINGIQTMHYEVYPILPETGSGNVLYLIGPIGTGADKYEEYVYYNNQWRKIGETSIDLSNYVTNDSLNTALASYVTSTSLATTLAGYVTDSELASALADVGSAFVAQYGTTTLSQIRTAALAGKALFALRSTMVFVFSGINDDDKWVFTKAGASGSVAAVFVDEYDTWTDGFVSLQDSSKRTDTLSGNENDSTKYLSTKGAATELAKKYEKPSGGIPAADIASGVIPTVPTISTNITTDANSDTKTASPKAVKTYADTKYTKPSGGIPASDLADGVVPTTASATVNSNSGTPSVSVSMSNGNLAFAFSNLKGDQGNTGSSVAYPYELVNNCTTNDATKGLSAAQGKALKDELNQLELKVSNLSGKYYGVFTSTADLPDDIEEPGYAFVGVSEPFEIYNFDGEEWIDTGASATAIYGQPGTDGVGFQSVTSLQDGTVVITLTTGDTITIDLNHNHPQYLKYVMLASEGDMPVSPDSTTLYMWPETS